MTEAKLARGVDVLGGCDDGLVEPDRLHGERTDQSSRHETGDVLVDDHTCLADRLGEGASRGEGLVGGLEPAYELAELHQRYGREEVRADHSLRAVGDRSDVGDGDGRGVRGEDSILTGDAVEDSKNVVLHVDPLEHRL